MVFYVKFDPNSNSIVDYSTEFNEDIHVFYLKIDLGRDYGSELAYIHQSYRQGRNYRPSSLSVSIKEIQRILLEKIRQDKLDYLIK